MKPNYLTKEEVKAAELLHRKINTYKTEKAMRKQAEEINWWGAIPTKKLKTMKVTEILNNYSLRDLEISYNNYTNEIYIYKYIPHTEDEESGPYLGGCPLAEFEAEFAAKYGYTPKESRDYMQI